MYDAPVIENQSGPVSPPESYAGGTGASEPAGEKGGSVKSIKDRAFDAIANDTGGDIADYVAERKDRDAEERGDPSVNDPHRKELRAERLQRALDRAKAEDGNDSRDAPEGHHEGSDDRREIPQDERANIRAAAQHEMRAAEFSKANPDYLPTIQAIFSVIPPAEHVAGALLRSPVGPEIAFALANNIEAIEELNRLPPDQAMLYLAKVEGVIMGQRQGQRTAEPPSRKTTKAPPPLSRINGGASGGGGFNPETSSMDEYVARRNAGWKG